MLQTSTRCIPYFECMQHTSYILHALINISHYNALHILYYILYIYGIYLRYDHLCNILKISLTNDLNEISVPVMLPYMRGIYAGIYHAYMATWLVPKFRRSHLSEISRGYHTSNHISGIFQQLSDTYLVYDMSCLIYQTYDIYVLLYEINLEIYTGHISGIYVYLPLEGGCSGWTCRRTRMRVLGALHHATPW